MEINDTGLLARTDPEAALEAFSPSPGYVLLEGDALLTGQAAAARARLEPRRVNDRFWMDLGTDPLPPPFPPGLTHADLAHAHLSQLHEQLGLQPAHVLLAVPGSHTPEQLGLMLGIARACELPVEGMVDAAVAAAADARRGMHAIHLDLQLHQAVATELIQERGQLMRRRVEKVPHLGVTHLHERWVHWIARVFVNRTRFDPLHLATTEQMLHARLAAVLGDLLHEESCELSVAVGGTTHGIELSRADLVREAETAYRAAAHLVGLVKRAGRPSTLLLSHRAGGLPGLREHLMQIAEMEIRVLPPEAATAGALRHRGEICAPDEALPFVTCLPVPEAAVPDDSGPGEAPPPAPGGSVRRRGRPPTHLLHRDQAHAITREPLVLGTAVPAGSRGVGLTGQTAGISRSHCSVYVLDGRVVVEDHSSHGSFLNGQRIDGRVEVVAGDQLRLGSPGIVVRLIEMV